MRAHEIFEAAESIARKVMIKHGHKIGTVEWEFNTAEIRCARCNTRCFFNITIAGATCSMEVFLGKGINTYCIGSTDHKDVRRVTEFRHPDYVCPKVVAIV